MKFTFDRNFFVSGALALVMILVMAIQGYPLKTATTPAGILSLEFARTTGRVDEILAAWKFLNLTALWNTLIDFAFLTTYGFFFHYGIKFLMANNGNRFWHDQYSWLIKMAWLPSILDAIENIFMLGWLLQFVPSYSPGLVFVLVCIKFSSAAVLFTGSFYGWVINLYRRTKNAI